MTVVIRPATERDYGYVHTSWVESWRYQVAPGAVPKAWADAVGADVASRMRAGRLVVACDVDDADRLYGFACGKAGRLWYVYVRETRRRRGLAARLVGELGDVSSCSTMVPTMQLPAIRRGWKWEK